MPKPRRFFLLFTESGPLIALAVAVALSVWIVGPASAQFFNFGGPPRPPAPVPQQQPRTSGGGFGGRSVSGDLVAPLQPPQQPAPAPKPICNRCQAPRPE